METIKIYTFIGVELMSSPDTEVVSMGLVWLDNSQAAIKFAGEVSTFGVQNVMMLAATSDEVLSVLIQEGLVPYQYHMESSSFSRIVL